MSYYLALLFLILFQFCDLVWAEYRCGHDTISKKVQWVAAEILPQTPSSIKGSWRTETADFPDWAPLRFFASTLDINDPTKTCGKKGQIRPSFDGTSMACRQQDVLTTAKKKLLLNELIPRALKLHSDRLLVRPIQGKIRIPHLLSGLCSEFNIPTNHRSVGVAEADMIIYVASGPTSDITAAWASMCSVAPNRRPVAGVMNYGPHVIEANEESVRVAAHEIGHAIGFDALLMGELNMLRYAHNIRGQTRFIVGSSATRRETQLHYNCFNIAGMELENQGGQGTALSHWERRNAKDELMGGFGGTAAFYSAMTMAAFDDMKFYRANWGMEEEMEWGNQSGCAFLTEKCIVNGVTKFPEMFCTEKGPHRCTSDRRGLGLCRVVSHDTPLPPEFQYFNSPHVGGEFIKLTDFCPYIESVRGLRCHDGIITKMPGSVVGPLSTCLEGESLQLAAKPNIILGDVCAEVSCTDGNVRVRYAGDDAWYLCPEGKKIEVKGAFSKGFIVCPKAAKACHIAPILKREERMVHVSLDTDNTLTGTHHLVAVLLTILLTALLL